MTEADLRNYIRRELLMEYQDLSISAGEFDNVIDAFANVFKVGLTGIKDIMSATRFALDITFAADKNKVIEAKRAYNQRFMSIMKEYDEGLVYARKSMTGVDLNTLLFVTNPGIYLAKKTADLGTKGFSDYNAVRDWFKDAGWPLKPDDEDPTPPGLSEEDAALAQVFLGGPTAGGQSMMAQQKAIQSSLDKIFGFMSSREGGAGGGSSGGGGSVSEAVRRNLNENFATGLQKMITQKLEKLDPESLGVDKSAAENVLKMKREQADGYVKMIEAPLILLQQLQKAKTFDDVRKAVGSIENSPFKISGLEKMKESEVEEAAKKAIEEAKKKDKLDKLKEAVGATEETTDEELFSLVKGFQLKNALANIVLSAKKSIGPTIVSLIDDFSKDYLKDVSLEELKKYAPGSELEKVITTGLEKIKSAGKRQPSA